MFNSQQSHTKDFKNGFVGPSIKKAEIELRISVSILCDWVEYHVICMVVIFH